jgi:hypothetical protein
MTDNNEPKICTCGCSPGDRGCRKTSDKEECQENADLSKVTQAKNSNTDEVTVSLADGRGYMPHTRDFPVFKYPELNTFEEPAMAPAVETPKCLNKYEPGDKVFFGDNKMTVTIVNASTIDNIESSYILDNEVAVNESEIRPAPRFDDGETVMFGGKEFEICALDKTSEGYKYLIENIACKGSRITVNEEALDMVQEPDHKSLYGDVSDELQLATNVIKKLKDENARIRIRNMFLERCEEHVKDIYNFLNEDPTEDFSIDTLVEHLNSIRTENTNLERMLKNSDYMIGQIKEMLDESDFLCNLELDERVRHLWNKSASVEDFLDRKTLEVGKPILERIEFLYKYAKHTEDIYNLLNEDPSEVISIDVFVGQLRGLRTEVDDLKAENKKLMDVIQKDNVLHQERFEKLVKAEGDVVINKKAQSDLDRITEYLGRNGYTGPVIDRVKRLYEDKEKYRICSYDRSEDITIVSKHLDDIEFEQGIRTRDRVRILCTMFRAIGEFLAKSGFDNDVGILRIVKDLYENNSKLQESHSNTVEITRFLDDNSFENGVPFVERIKKLWREYISVCDRFELQKGELAKSDKVLADIRRTLNWTGPYVQELTTLEIAKMVGDALLKYRQTEVDSNVKNKQNIKYLAAPYSHENSDIMESRFNLINMAAASLLKSGHHIYSPISHCHQMAKDNDMPKEFDFWRKFDTAMISVCSELLVLRLPGWKESAGVQAEIKIAKDLGIPVRYIDFGVVEAAPSPVTFAELADTPDSYVQDLPIGGFSLEGKE